MENELVKTPMEKMKSVLSSESVQEQFKNALAENSSLFVASLIDVYGSDAYLQKCSPALVVAEALKAAVLKLPISKGLGFAYIVPYKQSRKEGGKWVSELIPQMQIGYKGYLQLAMRSGIYRFINADVVLEGELQAHDKLTGQIDLSGEPISGEIVGYFAYIETVNGFRKAIFWSHEKVLAHAKTYSKSFDSKKSAWATNFEAMALKTVLKALLSKYGQMSVEMAGALSADQAIPEEQAAADVAENANRGPVLDIELEKMEPNESETTPGPDIGDDVPLEEPAVPEPIGPGF